MYNDICRLSSKPHITAYFIEKGYNFRVLQNYPSPAGQDDLIQYLV